MSAKVRLKDVAARAGVSVAAVSYVLSGRAGGKSGIGEQAASRIHEAATALGYVPDRSAQAIRTGKTKTILLSLTMLADPWALALIEVVQARAAAAGFTSLILADTDWTSVVRTNDADVFFIDAVAPHQRAALRELAARGKKLVVFDERLEPENYDVVRSRSRAGCELMMAHVISHHRQIALLTTESAWRRKSGDRVEPYLDALAAAEIPVSERYVGLFDGSPTGAYAAALTLLGQPERPRAIYATSDFSAISAISAAQHLGIQVGSDIEIVGVGNSVQSWRMTPSLSTTGPEGFFDSVAQLVVGRAQHTFAEMPHELVTFDWKVFLRQSSGIEPERVITNSEG